MTVYQNNTERDIQQSFTGATISYMKKKMKKMDYRQHSLLKESSKSNKCIGISTTNNSTLKKQLCLFTLLSVTM